MGKALPQIYVWLTEGGMAEWEVTRGDIDVIFIDWDEYIRGERSIEDWEGLRENAERIASAGIRKTVLDEIDQAIADIRDQERMDEENEKTRERLRIDEAKKVLRDAGIKEI